MGQFGNGLNFTSSVFKLDELSRFLPIPLFAESLQKARFRLKQWSLPWQDLQQSAVNQSAEMRDDSAGECTVAN